MRGEDLLREGVDPCAERIPVAGVKGLLRHDLDGVGGLTVGAGGDVAVDGALPVAAMGEEFGLSQAQPSVLVGGVPLQLGDQELAEELVVLVPGALRVERECKKVLLR